MTAKSAKPRKPPSTPKRKTLGAAAGMCIHRVSLTSWCKRCAGE